MGHITRAVVLVLFCGVLSGNPYQNTRAAAKPVRTPPDAFQVYFPVAGNQRSEVIGVEVWRGSGVRFEDMIADLGVDWVRYNFVTYQAGSDNIWQATIKGLDVSLFREDIAAIRRAGAKPLVAFMGNDAGCGPVLDTVGYVGFMAAIVAELELDRIEIWNEPDFTGGLVDLYGCHGDVDAFIELADAARAAMPDVMIGASVSGVDAHSFAFARAIRPHLDWIGVHRYGYYNGGDVIMPHDDYIAGAWLTEVNLLNDDCSTDPDYLAAQVDFVDGLLRQSGSVFVYVLTKQPSWRCAAMLDPDLQPLPVYDFIRDR